MQLIIAEKNSVGETIAKVLGISDKKDGYIEGKDTIVSWCQGHLVGLSLPEKYGEEYKRYRDFSILPIIPQNWKFESSSGKTKQLNVLRQLMKRDDIDEIVCATDAGREGECIFRYVYDFLGCHKPVKRLWISSMEDTSIRKGLDNLKPESEYDNLYYAGLCRAKADWLIGMNGSRLFSTRLEASLNIGRVQTPVLAMIVQRDYDIEHFEKQKYYKAELDCGGFTALSDRIDDKEKAQELLEKCKGIPAVISEIQKETKTENPPELYDLTTLQREANRKFGYTAKQTLDYTQSLYESKLVTYPRTDSRYLTEDMENTALDMVQTILGVIPDFRDITVISPNIRHCLNNKKVSDHTAIIPTAAISSSNLKALPDGERNILLLISLKLLLASAEPHCYENTKITVNCGEYDFIASGKTVILNGYKEIENAVFKTDTRANNILPTVAEGQKIEKPALSLKELYTTPPKSYTEDTILKAMEHAGNGDYDNIAENADIEKKGLGTPATRADIIENLVKHKYIKRDGKKIIAEKRGASLISVLPEQLKSPKLTAEWETKLQKIEQGAYSPDSFIDETEQFIKKLVSDYSVKANEDEIALFAKEGIGKCPRCGRNVVEGKLNYYCESGADGCGFTIWKKLRIPEAKVDLKTAKKFLTEGKAELSTVNKDGKPYTGMFQMTDDGEYVNFRYIKDESTAIGKCPKCGKNVFEYAKTYSCEDRECHFVIWKKINEQKISDKHAKQLLEKGKTELIKGFKKRNSDTKFDAYLTIGLDYNLSFSFPPKK